MTFLRPALVAASRVSSRATGSNEAGTVRKTSWFSSLSAADLPAMRAFHAVAQVVEKSRRRIHGRDPGNVVGRAPGKNGGMPINALMGKPALGGADQPAWYLGAMISGECSNHAVAGRFPRQLVGAAGGLFWGRQVQERREQRAFRNFGLRDDLGDRQTLDGPGRVAIRRGGIGV